MKKGLKFLLIAIVVVVVLLLVPIGIFLAIDLNNYKQPIADAVEKATGRQLTIEGKLSKSIFPWLGVEVGKVSLSNAKGFEPANFAQADKIQVEVALLPLFKRQIHVADVVLHGLHVNLAINKQGVSNWAPTPAPAAAPPAKLLAALVIGGVDIRNAQVRWDDQQTNVLYEVDHFNLSTGEIRLDRPVHAELSLNARTNQVKASTHLEWQGDIALDLAAQRYRVAKMRMALAAELDDKAIPVKKLDSDLSADVDVDMKQQKAKLKHLKLNMKSAMASAAGSMPVKDLESGLSATNIDVDLQHLAAAVQNLTLNLSANMISGDASMPVKHLKSDLSADSVDLQQQKAAVKHLKLGISAAMAAGNDSMPVEKVKSDLSAEVSVDLQQQKAAVNNLKLGMNATMAKNGGVPVKDVESKLSADVAVDIQRQAASVKRLKVATKATMADKGAPIAVKKLESNLSADVNVDMQRQTAAVNNLVLSALGIKLSGHMTSKQLKTSPTYAGRVDIAPFSPRKLTKTLGIKLPPMADAKVLAKASLGFAVQGGMDDVSVDRLKLVLDDTTLTGKAGVKKFARPAINYALNVDKINVDRYLPPPSKKSKTPPPTPGTAATAATQLPLEPLRSLDVNGTLNVGHLTAQKLIVEKIKTAFRAKGGQLRLHPVSARLYGGSYSGDVRLDVRSKTPKVAVDEHLKGVNVEPVLKAVADFEKLSGKVTLDAKLTTAGVELPAMMKSLNGTAAFHFRNGAVKDVDLAQMVRDAYEKVSHSQLPPSSHPGQTDFAEMKGSAKIRNGVVRNNDLSVKSPALRVAGKGSVDLPKEQIDYHLQVALVKTAEGQGGKEVQDLTGINIPVLVSGTFKQPNFSVDSEVIKTVLKAKARQALEKEKAAARKKLDEKREAAKKAAQKKLEQKKAEEKDRLDQKKQEVEDKLKDKLKGLFGR
jgi:AsmA protein